MRTIATEEQMLTPFSLVMYYVFILELIQYFFVASFQGMQFWEALPIYLLLWTTNLQTSIYEKSVNYLIMSFIMCSLWPDWQSHEFHDIPWSKVEVEKSTSSET